MWYIRLSLIIILISYSSTERIHKNGRLGVSRREKESCRRGELNSALRITLSLIKQIPPSGVGIELWLPSSENQYSKTECPSPVFMLLLMFLKSYAAYHWKPN